MAYVARLLIIMAVAVVTAMMLSWVGVIPSSGIAWLTLLVGIGISWRMTNSLSSFSQRYSWSDKIGMISFWEWVLLFIFVLASLRSFLWLIYHDGDVIKVLSPNNLGDLSLHITLIRYLSLAHHWWPMSPLLIHEPLRYSIGPDLLNSLLLLIGIPLEQGLLGMGLLGAVLTGVALWQWGRGFAIASFLFNGGLAGILVLKGVDPDTQVVWKNFFLSMFVTQRGFLYALPAGLLLLTTWKKSFIEILSKAESVRLSLPVQALLLGVMPLFSVHSFLFLAAMMVGIAILVPSARKRFALLVFFAWPAALLAIMIVSGQSGGGQHFLGWNLGWMQEGNPLYFWVWNFGISLPLSIFLIFFLKVKKEKAGAFVFPATVVFLLCLFIRFAPWSWDNMKLMLWSWLTVAPFLWEHIIRPRSFWVRGILCFLLFGSGVATLVEGLSNHHGYEIAERQELDRVAALLKSFPAEAVIATSPDYNHPVLLLGHPVVAGYEGHLWSHGLSYQDRLAVLKFIMNGVSGWEEKARELGVAAIYWSKWEQAAFPHSQLPFAQSQQLPMIYRLEKRK